MKETKTMNPNTKMLFFEGGGGGQESKIDNLVWRCGGQCGQLEIEQSRIKLWPLGHCVMFLGKTLTCNSHRASLHPGV